MSNIYLEKVANALTRAIRRGAVTSVSMTDRAGKQMGAAALNRRLTGATTFGTHQVPQVRRVLNANGVEITRNASSAARAVTTPDVLAKSTIHERLAARKKAVDSGRIFTKPTTNVFGKEIPRGKTPGFNSTGASASATGSTMFDKAKSFISANPKTSVGIGAAVGAGVGYTAGRNTDQNPY